MARRNGPMTISIELVITLKDPEQWTVAFGIEERARIRQDVKSYVLNQVCGAGVFVNGEVTADIKPKR